MTLKEELLNSFHTQFSENQNHYQKLFFQILSVIVTVMIGYSYVYTNGGKLNEEKINNSVVLLSFVLIISTIVIGLSLILLCNMAYSFRRDQFVINEIRKREGLIGNLDETEDYFPKNYNPSFSFNNKIERYNDRLNAMNFLKKYTFGLWIYILKRLSWMPNFHNSLYFMLYVIQIIIFLSYIFNPFDNISLFEFDKEINFVFILTIGVWVLLNIIVLRSQKVFWNKLNELFEQNEYTT